MSHPEFIELLFDKHRAACQAGLQRAASPLTGLQGCPLLLSLSSRAAAGGTQKEKKEFLRGHPAPRPDTYTQILNLAYLSMGAGDFVP